MAPAGSGGRAAGRGIGKALDGLAYIDRAGTYGDQAHGLEAVGGTERGELAKALEAVDQAAVWRNGPTAEKVALTLVVELPIDSSAEARRAAAAAIAAAFGQGGPVGWAIHRPPSDNGNWHLHLIRPARPLTHGPDGWSVDRNEAGKRLPPPFRKPHQKKALRAEIAAAVNRTCSPAVEYHPGTLRDIGIGREGRKRLPQWAWPLRDRTDAEAAIRTAAATPQQADQAVYVHRWNIALDRGEDPMQDPFVVERRLTLARQAAERRQQRAAAAAAQQTRKERELKQAAAPLMKAARATDRRRLRQVLDAGRSYRADHDEEMRRADAATRQAREATAALARERRTKAEEIAAAELRGLTTGEQRFLQDRLRKHLPLVAALEVAATADVDTACRQLAFRLAKAEKGSAEADKLRKEIEVARRQVITSFAAGLAFARDEASPAQVAAIIGVPMEVLFSPADLSETASPPAPQPQQSPRKPAEPPPAPPAPSPPPEPQTPLSGPPAGHKRPFRGRG